MNKKSISKQKIIRAAASVLSNKGLEKTTVDDIANKADIAKGSIYLYFKSKDQILESAIAFAAQKRIETLTQLLKKYKSPIKKIHLLLQTNKKIAKHNPDLFLMNYALLLSTHKDFKTRSARIYFQSYLDFVTKIVKKAQKKGYYKGKNPQLLALALILSQDFSQIFQHLSPTIIKKYKTKDFLNLFK